MRYLILVCLCCVSCTSSFAQSLAITNINLVDVENDAVLPDHFLLTEADEIKSVGPMSEFLALPDWKVIDGEGGFLLPGLADMHVHLEYFDNKEIFWLFLANGVTLVRQMEGNAKILEWRAGINQGQIPGPEIVSAGPIIDGDPPVDPAYRVPRTALEAQQLVRQQHAAGYDFIKIYHGLVPEVFSAIVSTAAELNMKVAGHVPYRVGLESILEQQAMHSIEHLDGYDDAIQPLDSPFLPGWHWRKLAMAVPVDSARLNAVATLTRNSGIWHTPTLSVKDMTWLIPEVQQRRVANSNLEYLPEHVKDAWLPEHWDVFRRQLVAGFGEEEFELLREGFRTSTAVTRALHLEGVPLLAGTDSPNPYLVPGFSLHDELGHLVNVGLTPAEALATSTVNVARYLGRENNLGKLAPGYEADAILLTANPLTG
ncbi:MAG: amidohydrolase family protein, partial [Pseudomonadales bacterium]|nr:amidohydrolase family protein [Pseudomonadales bacterium]